jgi:hypothetical protein
MAIGTAGTTSTTSLTALFAPGSYISPGGTAQSFPSSVADLATVDANVATINQAIKDDQNPNLPAPGAGPMWGWSKAGQLYVPNRGWLKVLPGDLVAVDTQGWPVLISARSAASGQWPHTAT